MKNAVCLMGLMVSGLCAFGDVWTDCTSWFVGADDRNSSGQYDTGELFDIRHINDTTQSGTKDVAARNNIQILTEDVFCATLGRELKNQKVLYFDGSCTVTNNPSGATESAKDIRVNGNCIKLADPITNTSYTALIRFKPDAHHPWSSSYQNILNLGFNMVTTNGVMVGFPNTPGQNQIMLSYGNVPYADFFNGAIQLTNVVYRSRSDVWHDLALVVSPVNATTVRFRMGLANPADARLDNYGASKMQWAQKDVTIKGAPDFWSKPYASSTRFGGESGTSGANGKTQYRGKVHMLALWNRALSDKEVIEAFGTPNPALLRLGVAGASGADLFKGATDADVTVSTRPEDWGKVPAKLVKDRKLTIGFEIPNWQTNATQILRFRPSAGAGTISVSIDGTVVNAAVAVQAGKTACVGIHRRLLQTVGAHTCTIVRTDAQAGDLVPGSIALSGSWQISPHDSSWAGMNSAGATVADYYVADGNFQHMRRVILPTTYPVNIHFDVPDELSGYESRLVWATASSSLGHKSRILLNSQQVYDEAVVDRTIHTLKLPGGSLRAGENILRWEDSSSASGYYGFDFIRLEIVSPSGLVLLFR